MTVAPRYHHGMKMSRLALIVAGLLVLAACGNKGPLVLPQKPAPVQDPLPPPVEPAAALPPATTEPTSPKTEGGGTPR